MVIKVDNNQELLYNIYIMRNKEYKMAGTAVLTLKRRTRDMANFLEGWDDMAIEDREAVIIDMQHIKRTMVILEHRIERGDYNG